MSIEYTTEMEINFGPDGNSLIPVVTQDFSTKEVLIISFCNKKAFEHTIKTGYATYWSRSRNELWQKGLTSGDMLRIREIRINCEQNSLLFLAVPEGEGACHAINKDGKHFRSCFYRRVLDEDRLEFCEGF